ncbi:choice-of-anchor L domain-containing protein [Fluviicola taffensis]|uniref:PKD domain containing protein n=1 Tax=Fluviicola taffensis (strain DSM 16823 / NCIMB 13979 / RW262) TaxID=755732 RepID=F2I9C1_FLUTR|nr:choice-of-anchor L domain-containing protein [Fluviicola taffensis]AEA44078.1 PKD domain containing protein [Fluviicola taffensis DSM 16823]
MMQKIYTTILMIGFFAIGKIGFSQINLSQTTINNYVANICGTGVSFSNVTLTGDAGAIAQFTGGVSGGLGATMNNGVVMSTGFVNTAGEITGTALKSNDNSGVNGISQLNTIAGFSTYDGIILEFDFVPITNQINVNFQFGSEEYNNFVDDIYNDVFAFLISGPGIAGTQNIALVPSTSTPVTINSINNGYAATFFGNNACSSGPCNNCTYYNDNCSSTFNNAMNGFTTVLTASQTVTPCQTYHIRLMLADGFDQIYDSWVFIQQDGLFAVGNPPLSLAATYPFGTALYEECFNSNTITFTIPTAQASDYSFNVTWGGTATSGVDYSSLPTTITIPAGQTSINLPINVFTDALAEGIETIECSYPISVCAMGTAIINIDDAVPLTVNAGPDADVCGGVASANLSATAANGNGAVTYSWDNGAGNTQAVSVLPPSTTVYTVTATDQCGRTATDQVTVFVGAPPVIDAGANVSICSGGNTTLTASGGITYTWDNGLGAGNGVSVSPIITTTYNVTGTAANGCSSTDALTITVNAAPIVNAGIDQTICQGETVILSGSGSQTYSWNNSVTNGVSFTPASTQTYTVTGTDANGCQGTDQVLVTVNPLPTVNAGTDQIVCAGGSITLSGSGAQTYVWNNGVTNAVSFTPASTQTYTVTGTDVNGCENTDQVLVTLSSGLIVNAGVDQSVCAGGSITLSATGGQAYVWNNGVTNTVSFIPVSTQTYSVTGTDAFGCQGTDQVVVTVNPLPIVDAGLPQSVCQGIGVTLNGSGAVSYTWNNGVTNGTSFTPSSTQTYTVTGTNSNGCTNTDQVIVTVNPSTPVNAGIDQAVCQDGSVILTATGAPQTYVWSNGVANGVSFNPGSTQTYTVTGTNANGCESTDQVVVTVNALPTVSAGIDLSVCVGGNIILNGSGAVSYTWNNGVSNGVPFVPGSTQTYTLTGTDVNGCTNTDQVTISVVPIPTASISSDVNSGNPVLTVNFDNNSSNASTYHWNFGNGSELNATTDVGQQSNYSNSGQYMVVLTAANGSCIDTDTLLITVIPFPDPIIVIPNIFTPNNDKNNDEFFITVSYVKSVKVSIFNRWGNKMCDYDNVHGSWDGTVNGDMSSEGVYFFKYEIEGINGTMLTGQGNIQLIR